MLWVDGDASHGADLHTLGFFKMADAFGAFGRVDFVDFFTQINRLIWALGLAHIAVDAFIGDHQGHDAGSTQVGWDFMGAIIGHTQHPEDLQGCYCTTLTSAPNSQGLK
jgi:hypothetical protein